MTLNSTDLAELIEPLTSGIVEESPWSVFLDRLRQRLRADYASLVFRPLRFGTPQNRVVHLFSGRDSPPVVSQLYRESLYMSDPMPYHQMEDGRVFALSDLLRLDDPDHQAYRDKLLIPSGMNFLRMMRVTEASGVGAWLTVSRRDGEFRVADDRLIAELAPFLRAALRVYIALERERINATVANEAISRMNFSWLTLDADGRILDTDAQGEMMLADSGILSRGRNGRLTASVLEVSRDIDTAIRDLARNPKSRPRAIVLNREPWLDMLLVPANLRMGATRPTPSLLAYVHADRWSSVDRCDQLREMFDLIPSEARLALALGRGMSIAEAAVELGLSIESARTYSKRIYAKTGARGQADLVRFIHRSVLAIA
jgi:DNA-binding CsgD family transcriptional regulator